MEPATEIAISKWQLAIGKRRKTQRVNKDDEFPIMPNAYAGWDEVAKNSIQHAAASHGTIKTFRPSPKL